MKTKRELKCVKNVFYVNSVINRSLICLPSFCWDQLVSDNPFDSMKRLKQKPKAINGRKYSSFWFALKAIQNNKLLRNNLSINKPLFIQNRLLMNGFVNDNNSSVQINENDTNNQSIDLSLAQKTANDFAMKGIQTFEIDSKKWLVLLSDKQNVYELGFGCLQITLLSENFDLDLNGFNVSANQTIEVMSAFEHKIIIKLKTKTKTDSNNNLSEKLGSLGVQQIDSILNQMNDNSCLFLIEKLSLSSLLFIEKFPDFKPLSIKPGVWFDFKNVENSLQYLEVWNKLYEDLNINENDVIIVCGGINVGKSSLIRHFINRYLSQNQSNDSIKHCFYMDCDPGQSEFSTAAQLSLTSIEKPILSPTVMNVLKKKPIVSSCVGANNANKTPKLYISSLNKLFNYFKNNVETKGPLFINTMGWTQDLGLALLTDIIKMSFPSHVIQMDSLVNNKINFPFNLTPESVQKHYGFNQIPFETNRHLNYKLSVIGSENKITKRSQKTRVSQQLAYFSQMPEIAFKPFHAMTPFKIFWSKVYLHIVSDTFLSFPLYIDALNCSWIHLCRIDEQNVRYSKFRDLKIIDSIDGNHCFGSAVVRGIDFKNKCFYILSPESPQILDSVNCIVKPFGLHIPEDMIREQFNYSSTSHLPYVYER